MRSACAFQKISFPWKKTKRRVCVWCERECVYLCVRESVCMCVRCIGLGVQICILLDNLRTRRSVGDPESDGVLKTVVRTKIRHYHQLYLTRPDPIVFLPVVVDPSGHTYIFSPSVFLPSPFDIFYLRLSSFFVLMEMNTHLQTVTVYSGQDGLRLSDMQLSIR